MRCPVDVVVEQEKKVPVAYDVDVAVAGSGVAGCFAAIAAARSGVETLLVDRFAYPGGNMGPGMIAGGSLTGGAFKHLNGGFTGIPREFIQRHVELGGGTVPESPNLGDLPPSPHPGDYAKDSGIVSYTLLKMLEEAGVRCLFSTFIADPIVEDDRVCGLFVENKSGRRAVRAKVVVDATGEADVAMRAGAAMIYPESYYALTSTDTVRGDRASVTWSPGWTRIVTKPTWRKRRRAARSRRSGVGDGPAEEESPSLERGPRGATIRTVRMPTMPRS